MIKPMMMSLLLLAIPTTSDNVKPLTKQEIIQLRSTVKNLEEITAEQQDRLQAHKAESDLLKKRVTALESRLAELEKALSPLTSAK
jgi:predicted  nucleic acid-binding Zn-ribbon protein